jgi:hypothetical protein
MLRMALRTRSLFAAEVLLVCHWTRCQTYSPAPSRKPRPSSTMSAAQSEEGPVAHIARFGITEAAIVPKSDPIAVGSLMQVRCGRHGRGLSRRSCATNALTKGGAMLCRR